MEILAKPASAGAWLSWQDVSLERKLRNGQMRRILKGVSGQAPPGSLCAILGGSGSGKTTLLNCIAQRVGDFSGTVLLNGQPPNHAFKRVMGYVQQDTPFLEYLTVRETLRFAARLRLPDGVPRATKFAIVEDVISDLDLGACASTLVGRVGEAGGISGGERRRLALGMELLFNPHVLLVDEVGLECTTRARLLGAGALWTGPSWFEGATLVQVTSGLDAASALRIVVILKKLALEGAQTEFPLYLATTQTCSPTAELDRQDCLVHNTPAQGGYPDAV
jgi:ABC-type nitrate/sulfonate/bicarbonate transport system ATPase subunit